MAKIDVLSLVLGVILSVLVTGFYNFFFYLFQGEMAEMIGALWATILTFIVTVLYLIYFFLAFKKANKNLIKK